VPAVIFSADGRSGRASMSVGKSAICRRGERVCVGRRRLPAARLKDHGENASGADRRDAGGQEELIGFPVGVRERARRAGATPDRREQRGPRIAPELPRRRRRSASGRRLTRSFRHPHQPLLVHKTVKRPGTRFSPLLGAGQHEEDLRGSLLGAEPGGRRSGNRRLRREIPAPSTPGGRMPRQGRERAAGFLQLSCRALGSLGTANPSKACRDRAAQNGADERIRRQRPQADGVQAGRRRIKNLAAAQRHKSVPSSSQVSDSRASRSSTCRKTTQPDASSPKNPVYFRISRGALYQGKTVKEIAEHGGVCHVARNALRSGDT